MPSSTKRFNHCKRFFIHGVNILAKPTSSCMNFLEKRSFLASNSGGRPAAEESSLSQFGSARRCSSTPCLKRLSHGGLGRLQKIETINCQALREDVRDTLDCTQAGPGALLFRNFFADLLLSSTLFCLPCDPSTGNRRKPRTCLNHVGMLGNLVVKGQATSSSQIVTSCGQQATVQNEIRRRPWVAVWSLLFFLARPPFLYDGLGFVSPKKNAKSIDLGSWSCCWQAALLGGATRSKHVSEECCWQRPCGGMLH